MKKRKISLETVTNGYGIRVNKACMSCAHKDYTRSKKLRFCCVTLNEVSPYHLCKKWRMSEQMEKAGSGTKKNVKM